MEKPKLIRTSTIALSLNYLLKGQLAYLDKYFEVIAISGDDEHLRAVAEREQVKVLGLHMERKMRPFKDAVSLFKLYKVFKKQKPDIVHSITPKAGLLSMVAAYFAGVPIRIHTFTGLIFPTKRGFTRKVLIIMDRVLCKCATAIYPEGEGVKSDLIKYGITKKHLKIIANGNVNGIDIEYFNPDICTLNAKQALRKELNINENDFVFIFVGRLVGDKGINELVNAFTQVSAKHNDAKLILVGNFEDDLDPLNLITLALIKSNKNIISVGFQADVRPYFSISNVLTFPSYREGFPNVVIQAGSMGLPSIVSDINGCNEIIIDGKNGIIIPVKNVDELVKSMEKILLNAGLTETLKSNAREMIASRYKQELVWNAILAEYKGLLGNV